MDTINKTAYLGTKDEALLPGTLVYDPVAKDPARYADNARRFQGIPGVERTKNGRLFYCFYTGTEDEGSGNYVLLLQSDDDAATWKTVLAVEAPTEMTRTFDPCLWIDDLGRLWLFYAQSYTHFDGRIGVWAAVCDTPDAEQLTFAAPRRIANGIMMNKPIVTDKGSWLLCCAIWEGFDSEYNRLPGERFSNMYCSADKGETFVLIGHADYADRCIDEPMAVQLSDGRIWMLIRAKHGIGQSFSEDGGFTWMPAEDSGLGGPCSRFCLRKLKSGNLLLVNHHEFKGRNNLKAMLSRDDGKTWEGFLMIDERADVSYPDVTEDDKGQIYIAYDWKRYHEKELYLAVVTEEDILAGKIVKDTSRLRVVVNKATGINTKR